MVSVAESGRAMAGLAAGAADALLVTQVGAVPIHFAVADDLRRGAFWFAIIGLGLITALSRLSLSRSALGGAALAAIGLTGLLVLPPLVGPRAEQLLSELSSVTHAGRTILISVGARLQTAEGLAKVQASCNDLEAMQLGAVACPTAVMRLMSSALVGVAELPKTDEQAQGLWFFGGDRPELGLVFDVEHTHALVRLTLPEAALAPGAEALLVQFAETHDARLGGLPLFHPPWNELAGVGAALVLFALGFGLVFLRTIPQSLAHTALALLGGALAVPVGIAAWLLALPAAGFCLAAALALVKKP
jgi:hypothetical protein